MVDENPFPSEFPESVPEEPDGWEWFAETGSSLPAADLARCYALCFASREGQVVFAHLRTLTLERTLGPQTSEPALRHLEGQRHLVHIIAALVRRGRETQPL